MIPEIMATVEALIRSAVEGDEEAMRALETLTWRLEQKKRPLAAGTV